MTTESLSITIEGELLTVEIGTVAAPAGGGGGSSDHGALTGLADDDHTQYALADGTRGTFEAAGAVATHAGATDPHGDRAFATSAVSTHSALTTGAHGITAAGAALLDDADAAAQRTTLGLGTAATQASSAFEASGAVSTHNAVTTAHGISAYGATLVDDADAATARTTLGLGTAATAASGDFAAASHNQAASTITSGTLAHERGGLEADVSAYSGLVKIAAGATSAVTVTAAGEALLDDADASAQRTTLGLGTAATTAATDYATAAQGTDDRTASGLRTVSTVVSVSAATAPSSGQVLTATSSTAATWQTPSGGGGSGDVVGPASATDNAIARYDTTTGKLLQDSGVTVSDVSGSSVTVASTAGNALALAATAPAATTGASVAGVATTITAGAAVASTDTAGAAAGGSVTITAGAAARLTSGNANGGDIVLATGAGIGTGTAGTVLGPAGTAARPAYSFSSDSNTGIYSYSGDAVGFSTNGTVRGFFDNNGLTILSARIYGNAAGAALLGLKLTVNNRTTDASEDGVSSLGIVTNAGTTALVTRTLPTATAGWTYTFVVMDADGLKIQAASGDNIRVLDQITGTAGYIQSTTVGSVVTLVAIDATTWVATSIHGVWTDGTFTFDDTANTTP